VTWTKKRLKKEEQTFEVTEKLQKNKILDKSTTKEMSNIQLSTSELNALKDVSLVARGLPAAHSAEPRITSFSCDITGNAATASDAKADSTLDTTLDAKAPLESPVFTGTPEAPTAPAGTSTNQIATTSFVDTAVSALVNGADADFDTLKELADRIDNDAGFANSMNTLINAKADSTSLDGLNERVTTLEGADYAEVALKLNNLTQTPAPLLPYIDQPENVYTLIKNGVSTNISMVSSHFVKDNVVFMRTASSGEYATYSSEQIGSTFDKPGGNFGDGVSISADGTIVAIGDNNYNNDTGIVRVYQRNDSNTTVEPLGWTQLGQDIVGEAPGDQLGDDPLVNLSADGTTIALGSFYNDEAGTDAGHVRVYRYSNNVWTQLGEDIDGDGHVSEEWMGMCSLSADGNILAVGAPGYGSQKNGLVRVFQYSNDVWTQLGGDIGGENASDWFGRGLSLNSDGTIVAIGARYNGDNGNDTGHVRVFQYSNNVWTQLGADIDGQFIGELSGLSCSLSDDGNIVAIGANRSPENGSASGSVRVFQYSNNAWTQLGTNILGEGMNNYFGINVSLSADGTTLAAGSWSYSYVNVYKYLNNSWIKLHSFDRFLENDNNSAAGRCAISSDGTTLIIGAPGRDGAKVFDLNAVTGRIVIDENNLTLTQYDANDSVLTDKSGSLLLLGPKTLEEKLQQFPGNQSELLTLNSFSEPSETRTYTLTALTASDPWGGTVTLIPEVSLVINYNGGGVFTSTSYEGNNTFKGDFVVGSYTYNESRIIDTDQNTLTHVGYSSGNGILSNEQQVVKTALEKLQEHEGLVDNLDTAIAERDTANADLATANTALNQFYALGDPTGMENGKTALEKLQEYALERANAAGFSTAEAHIAAKASTGDNNVKYLNNSGALNFSTSFNGGSINQYTLTSVIIGNDVTSIPYAAFQDCTELTSVALPNSLTTIETYGFLRCYSLTSITLPDSLTLIGSVAFANCSSLTTIALPNSVTTIGNEAFSGCTSLTSITLPNSLTTIETRTFRNCISLPSITLPDSLRTIKSSAFYNCSSLTSITLPNSLVTIVATAFSFCSSLTSINNLSNVVLTTDMGFTEAQLQQ
jgi:hypothetical protein